MTRQLIYTMSLSSLLEQPGAGRLTRIYAINEDNAGALWIGTVDAGVWQYSRNSLVNYGTKDGLGSNRVNTIFKDHQGVLWFGTDDAGLFQFNGVAFEKVRF